jgi:organic radical activating enzyme
MEHITWQDERACIPKVEFYINNTCNLTCNNCNRFNNYNFKGWQNFNDYREVLEKWGQLIQIQKIVILGGEPLLNPTLLDWIDGLNRIFDCPIQIQSNGLTLSKVKKLYSRLLDTNNWLGISWHNPDHENWLQEQVDNFLEAPIEKISNTAVMDDKTHITYIDRNNVKISVWVETSFETASIIPDGQGGLTLHNNNPMAAHNACSFAKYGCYHMIEGKLYKCGPVKLMAEFDKQHKLNINEEDRDLLNSYEPLTVDNYNENARVFLEGIQNFIPQCKFCPVQCTTEIIYPQIKGKQLPKTMTT